MLRPWQVSTICLLPVTDQLWSEMVVKGQDRPDPAKETPGQVFTFGRDLREELVIGRLITG